MPRIPIVEIAPVGDVFIPTENDRSSGIDAILSEKQPMFTAGNFEVLEHPATMPHTIDGQHMVYWLNRWGMIRPLPWNQDQLQELAHDQVFLSGFQDWLNQQRRERKKHAWVYFNLGFLPKSVPVVRDGVAYIGLQSQERVHVHLVDELPPVVPSRWLELADESSRSQWARLLNVAGEASIRRLQPQLGNFGRRITLTQVLGGERWHRTAYAFHSLADALPAIVELQNRIAITWLEHARELAAADPVEFAGYFFQAMQSAVPNFSAVLPNDLDRSRLSVEGEESVWVFPFNTFGPPEILVPDGLLLDRRPHRVPLHPPSQEHSADNPLDRQDVGGLAVR